jgi:hypothetical protein
MSSVQHAPRAEIQRANKRELDVLAINIKLATSGLFIKRNPTPESDNKGYVLAVLHKKVVY